MKNYSLVALDDRALMRGLHACASADRTNTADLIAHIAEVDHRKLYVPEACPSMYDYCVRRMNFSEDAASKRIQAARAARRFPAIFHMVADGRLHLSAVCLLAPHLTPENADELLTAAARQTKSSIEALLAARSAKSATVAMALDACSDMPSEDVAAEPSTQVVANSGEEHAPGHVDVRMRDSETRLSAAEVRALEKLLGSEARELVHEIRDLLGHALPGGQSPEVVLRSLRHYAAHLRRRKYGATDSPRRRRSHADGRYISADVRRAVWERDGGQCTFVSERGHRCEARSRLEFDHEVPMARGGRSTADNVRLRCRAHNQYAAERLFGAGFMHAKRQEAKARREAERTERERRRDAERAGHEQRREAERAAREQARADAQAARERERNAERAAKAHARAEAAARKQAEAARRALIEEVVPALQNLGYPLARARAAAATTESILDAPIKDRILLALKSLTPPCRRYGPDGREKVA